MRFVEHDLWAKVIYNLKKHLETLNHLCSGTGARSWDYAAECLLEVDQIVTIKVPVSSQWDSDSSCFAMTLDECISIVPLLTDET